MVSISPDRVRRPIIHVICAFLAALAGVPATARAEVTLRRPQSAPSWPPGTDLIPFELRDGHILVRARLLSPSGRDTTGLLVVDTGAPDLALSVSVWNMLNVDTLEIAMGYARRIRRTLTGLELGSARLDHVEVGGVIADSILSRGVIGLFAPSLYEDRAVGAGPLPFRRFQGGRILVTAQITEPAHGWRSQPLTLLFDTGASACVVFEDAMAERVRPPARWPLRSTSPSAPCSAPSARPLRSSRGCA